MNASNTCRSCGSNELTEFLDLGEQPLANSTLLPTDSPEEERRFPLKLAVCPDCFLVQITNIVPPEELFEDYLYFSSFSDEMLRHAKDAVTSLSEADNLDESSLAVEIASNDGYLLRNFVDAGIPCLGIEPARNIADAATRAGIPTRCEFFGRDCAEGVVAEFGRADLILGNNVFAHAPDINDFIGGLAILLKPTGRIALEFPYLGSFLENLQFDTAYHEHVFYFSLLALAPAFERHGLELFDVERLTIHGGSLRLHAGHRGAHEVTRSLKSLAAAEHAAGMDSLDLYKRFAARVHHLRERLLELIDGLKREGRSLAAYGASAKGSTLLNYFGIGADTLNFVVDRSTYKQGRLTPGTHLPIFPPEELAARKPDYTLLLTWNFADEILSQQRAYRDAGGKFIIPIPEPQIV